MANKWRFNSRYGSENGLDTSDMETFKKDPYASLAREITQNSIDAALGDAPVKIDFKLFTIPKEKIPGYDDLAAEIDTTWEYVSESNKDKKALLAIKNCIHTKNIKCLRISDFNTKGLEGASTNERGTPFYNLTKGSGVSDKGDTQGGSKGIGKFAAFVASTTNTVFYSTATDFGESANIGICKLRSRAELDDPDKLTEGLGYYAVGKKNQPIKGMNNLDPSFHRKPDNTGTDIYIIGFKDRKGWKEEITAKVLESFMVAILKGNLEICVDDITVTKDTAKEIIYESDLMDYVGKKLKKDIEAQYELLTQTEDEGVFSRELVIDKKNAITVYAKHYPSASSDRATKHNVMIRYPYMKIKYTLGYSYLPYSALCIIENNNLNKRLRDIENPQHTDWEIKRLDEETDEKAITKNLMKELDDAINAFIEEILQQSSSESTDLEGAGEFLPAQEESDADDASSLEVDQAKEELSVTPIKKVTPTTPRTAKVQTDADSYEFGEGGEGDEDDVKIPGDSDTPPNPNPNPEHEPNDDDQGGKEGNTPVLIKAQLSGMKYHIIVTDKKRGKYNIVFKSAFDEENCELSLKQFGAESDKYPVDIISAYINGEPCVIEEGKVVGFKMKTDKEYTIECKVNMNTLFAGEVILYAYR